jgi:hypothetical protein
MQPKPVCRQLSSSRLRGMSPKFTNGKGCIASERSAPKRAHYYCARQLTCGPIRIFALPVQAGRSLRLLGSQRVRPQCPIYLIRIFFLSRSIRAPTRSPDHGIFDTYYSVFFIRRTPVATPCFRTRRKFDQSAAWRGLVHHRLSISITHF